jgi:hypothetical protein
MYSASKCLMLGYRRQYPVEYVISDMVGPFYRGGPQERHPAFHSFNQM